MAVKSEQFYHKLDRFEATDVILSGNAKNTMIAHILEGHSMSTRRMELKKKKRERERSLKLNVNDELKKRKCFFF